tara:strand:- start:85 stop:516 length:432 start_codon:yes stop_codon:yes gene_type:complete
MIRAATDSASSQSVLHELAPDLTPLLDIVFILLVFFMLSAGVVLQSVDIKLPAGVAEALSPLPPSSHVVLEIQPHHYVLGGQNILQFSALKEAVKAAVAVQPGREFIIAGDRDISMARLLKVLTYLQSQGIVNANILMEEENN